jgi:hypothetical protein
MGILNIYNEFFSLLDLYKLRLFKLGYGGLVLGSRQFFNTAPAVSNVKLAGQK